MRAVDPNVRYAQVPVGVTRVKLEADEASSADAFLVLVDHDEFDLELVRRRATYMLGTRNTVQPGLNVDRL